MRLQSGKDRLPVFVGAELRDDDFRVHRTIITKGRRGKSAPTAGCGGIDPADPPAARGASPRLMHARSGRQAPAAPGRTSRFSTMRADLPLRPRR